MKVSKKLLVGSLLTGAFALGVIALNGPVAVSAMGNKPAAEKAPMAGKTYDLLFM